MPTPDLVRDHITEESASNNNWRPYYVSDFLSSTKWQVHVALSKIIRCGKVISLEKKMLEHDARARTLKNNVLYLNIAASDIQTELGGQNR